MSAWVNLHRDILDEFAEGSDRRRPLRFRPRDWTWKPPGRLIDLSYQKFGRLTARWPRPGRKWACRCECGTWKVVRAQHLRRGLTKSCGCLNRADVTRRNHRRARDFTGKRFGEWTVLRRVARGARTAWECACSCGEIKVHPVEEVAAGRSRMCRTCAALARAASRRREAA